MTGWHPTHAHLRATVAGLVLLVVGVALGRPDVVTIATPLVVVALWAAARRPHDEPAAAPSSGRLTVHEDEELAWEATVTGLPRDGCLVAVHPGQRWLEVDPPDGRVLAVADGTATAQLALRATRWGRRTLGEPALAAYDGWCAWRWGPVPVPPLQLTVLPVTPPFDSAAPAPHPRGLVGMERAARTGEGTEFAKVRPFQVGDRLRRVHWPVSARTGRLHVTATYADEDTQVVVLVDAVNDVGAHTGAVEHSSMDLAVRAAAALSEHFLRRGDRVGLRVFGAWGVSRVPSASGRLQLRRILDTLCLIEPGSARGEAALAARQGLTGGTLALMLSPLIDPAATQQVAILARAGIDVVVVDTMPERVATDSDDPALALAWRLRMLERRVELDRLAALGIPVVPWTGAHDLDRVLRDLTRRAAVPRMVAR